MSEESEVGCESVKSFALKVHLQNGVRLVFSSFIPDSYSGSTKDSDSFGGSSILSSGASSKAIRTEIVCKSLLFIQ